MASIKERNGKYCVIYNYVNPKGKRKQKWGKINGRFPPTAGTAA